MTSKQFLKRKNKIVKEVTGLTLIPKDQIVKHPFAELDISDNNLMALDSSICTYCNLYNYNNCKNCPINKADNYCSNVNSTWWKANAIWGIEATYKDRQKLKNLIIQYNEEKGKKL